MLRSWAFITFHSNEGSQVQTSVISPYYFGSSPLTFTSVGKILNSLHLRFVLANFHTCNPL